MDDAPRYNLNSIVIIEPWGRIWGQRLGIYGSDGDSMVRTRRCKEQPCHIWRNLHIVGSSGSDGAALVRVEDIDVITA